METGASLNTTMDMPMTPREKFFAALERRPISGRVPHFELVFFLTMEAFGRLHPTHRNFLQWDQMSRREQDLHIDDIADLYVRIAEKYEHSAIFYQGPAGWTESAERRCLERIEEMSSRKYALIVHGDCTFALPSGDRMMDFAVRMLEEPQALKDEAERMLESAIRRAEKMRSWGTVDTFGLCSDYCFNANPFFTPEQFAEFVAPYLKRLIAAYREMGYHVFKHTDGNIMPILDQLVDCNPHALHSLDPQGHVDIRKVKQLVGDKVALIGNVNCAKLQNGTPQEVEESVRYALDNGMPGYGYIFSTSNCVYTGMPLERYDLMLDIWRKYGNYA